VARRAAVLLPGVVEHPVAVEEPPVAVVEAAVVVDVVEREIEENKG
jgi:hypothetical protein